MGTCAFLKLFPALDNPDFNKMESLIPTTFQYIDFISYFIISIITAHRKFYMTQKKTFLKEYVIDKVSWKVKRNDINNIMHSFRMDKLWLLNSH